MTIHEENTVDEEDVKDGIGGQLSRNDEDCLFLGVSLNGDPDVLVEPEVRSLIIINTVALLIPIYYSH